MTRAFTLLAVLALAACGDPPLRVASKDFAENRILAEMFALLLESQGLTVDRQIPLGDTAVVFEALRSGRTDLYPEYTGTGLALLGLPPTADGAASRERVREELERLGITVLEPLGFESTYVVVVGPRLARERGVAEVADLANVASDLRIAVAEEFASRPEVGLQAFTDRYGLEFGTVEVVPEEERRSVYDLLLDGRADVVVGFGTDPEIATYGLTALEPSGDFFPDFSAIPVVSTGAMARHPEIAAALGALAGRLDVEQMRALVSAVALDGRTPGEVAREGLAALDLLEAETAAVAQPLRLAVDPAEVGGEMTSEVLRAARAAVTGRGLALLETENPVGAIFDGRARVALVPAVAQFDIDGEEARLLDGIETVAAVGSYYLHALARADGPASLAQAGRIAAGPAGTASHRLARAAAGRSDPPAEVVSLDSTSAAAAVGAVTSGAADAAIVLAPLGSIQVANALRGGDIELIPAVEWWVGAARVGLPFLRIATIPGPVYGKAPVSTLAMQATVIGPAPSDDVLGEQGPSTYSEVQKPVTDQVVLAFNEALGPHPAVAHYLRPSAVLTPQVSRVVRALNRTPGYTVLSLGIIAFLVWAGWLLMRPDERG